MDRIVIRTVALGAIAGLITGYLGIEGTFILVPGLLYLGIQTQYRIALGTTLAALVLPITLLGAYKYYEKGNVDIKNACVLGLTYLAVSYMTSGSSFYLSDNFMRLMAGVLYISVGMFSLYTLYFSGKKEST